MDEARWRAAGRGWPWPCWRCAPTSPSAGRSARTVAHARAAGAAREGSRRARTGRATSRPKTRPSTRCAREVTDKLEPEAQTPGNRYFEGSPIYPGRFAQDWNRSFMLEPVGRAGGCGRVPARPDRLAVQPAPPRAPLPRPTASSRSRSGCLATAPFRPALTDVEWDDWSAATRLAVREARRRIGPSRCRCTWSGYSNGGALAMKYALDALDDPTLSRARPARADLADDRRHRASRASPASLGWPAMFPAFAKAAWLGVVPEFNPFKYNSFPVNAARQSSLLTQRAAAADRATTRARAGWSELPPILTFQSVVDFTVSTRAIVTALYAHLPANGSELVLFDLNRDRQVRTAAAPELRHRAGAAPARRRRASSARRSSPTPTPDSREVVERVTEAGATDGADPRRSASSYPLDVYLAVAHRAAVSGRPTRCTACCPTARTTSASTSGAMAMRGRTRHADRAASMR